MNHSVIGIVHTRSEAESLVANLKSSGFADSNISVFFQIKKAPKISLTTIQPKPPKVLSLVLAPVDFLGGALGLAAGVGALAIPGVGPLIAAGPIMAALSGAAVGATVGGLGGALVGMGIPEYEAKIYEGKVRDGNILIAAHCADKDQVKRGEDLFKAANAADIIVSMKRASRINSNYIRYCIHNESASWGALIFVEAKSFTYFDEDSMPPYLMSL